jgi:hypothetical protein
MSPSEYGGATLGETSKHGETAKMNDSKCSSLLFNEDRVLGIKNVTIADINPNDELNHPQRTS